jgi:type I restriction-modification system DNA methylase subunit
MKKQYVTKKSTTKFIETLKNINRWKTPNEIFNDWLVMASAALYSWKKDKKVEEEYTQIEKRYSKEQMSRMAELFAIVTLGLQEEKTDFLGNIYSILGLGNKKLGQFFTPYNMARLMAEIAIDPKTESKRILKIYDPACGSGVMLIAVLGLKEMHDTDFKKNILLVGQDIDVRCVHMSFIQLSLLGAAAIVIYGDTLTNEVIWQRETFWYHAYDIEKRLAEQEKKEKDIKLPRIDNELLKKHLQKELF